MSTTSCARAPASRSAEPPPRTARRSRASCRARGLAQRVVAASERHTVDARRERERQLAEVLFGLYRCRSPSIRRYECSRRARSPRAEPAAPRRLQSSMGHSEPHRRWFHRPRGTGPVGVEQSEQVPFPSRHVTRRWLASISTGTTSTGCSPFPYSTTSFLAGSETFTVTATRRGGKPVANTKSSSMPLDSGSWSSPAAQLRDLARRDA